MPPCILHIFRSVSPDSDPQWAAGEFIYSAVTPQQSTAKNLLISWKSTRNLNFYGYQIGLLGSHFMDTGTSSPVLALQGSDKQIKASDPGAQKSNIIMIVAEVMFT